MIKHSPLDQHHNGERAREQEFRCGAASKEMEMGWVAQK